MFVWAGGNGQKFSVSGIKKTARRALIQKHTQWVVTVESKSWIPDILGKMGKELHTLERSSANQIQAFNGSIVCMCVCMCVYTHRICFYFYILFFILNSITFFVILYVFVMLLWHLAEIKCLHFVYFILIYFSYCLFYFK